jgi:Mn-containing catalase
LEKLPGADVGKLLPIPDVSNRKCPEAAVHEKKGLHRVMYRWSPEDYRELDQIWNGPHPEDGQELIVEDETPEGASWPELEDEPQLSAPGAIDPEMIKHFAKIL